MSRINRLCSSMVLVYIRILLIYTKILLFSKLWRMWFIIIWKVIGVLIRPIGITRNLKRPYW